MPVRDKLDGEEEMKTMCARAQARVAELGLGEWDFAPPTPPTPLATAAIDVLAPLRLSAETVARAMCVFEEEMERGLAQRPSSLQMENSYVPELPDGSEEGMFLALDLGGTKFRVLMIELRDGRVVRSNVKEYHIDLAQRLGPGDELFRYLAECVADFVYSEGLQECALPLGFTFSFPMRQHSISSGELITWTKSFNCPGMEGIDVAELLQRHLRPLVPHVTVQVLLNDTTGTLVAGALHDPRVAVGIILGTGSNGCYLERADRVQHWETGHDTVRDVIVDIEWGAFGDNGCLDFLRTDYDREVDERSLLTASFTFEKYISGKYLGDLLRAVLARLARDGQFPGEPEPGVLTTEHVSQFEEEEEAGGWRRTAERLAEALGGAPVQESAARLAQYAARLVSNRAAVLVSVCVAALLERMARAHSTVAVDGSVFRHHPRIAALMRRYVGALAPRRPFGFLLTEDGSGKGAAITAAIGARLAARP